MYPSSSLTSSLLLSTSSSTTGFGFGNFFGFVGKSLGQVPATFSLSCPIFQLKTMPNLILFLLIFAYISYCSFQLSSFTSLVLLFGLGPFSLASLSTDRTPVKHLPSPFLLMVCTSSFFSLAQIDFGLIFSENLSNSTYIYISCLY